MVWVGAVFGLWTDREDRTGAGVAEGVEGERSREVLERARDHHEVKPYAAPQLADHDERPAAAPSAAEPVGRSAKDWPCA